MAELLRFLFVGDVAGQPGVCMFQKWIPILKERHKIDAVIVNGENSAKNGLGITPKHVHFFRQAGADVVTTGNHVWHYKDFYNTLNERDDVIRPANYAPGCPGKGHTFISVGGVTVAIVNLHGRVFMKDLFDCPFRCMDSLLTYLSTKTNLIFVDFHAEATSEKRAMGVYLDGRISGIVGTHTHVQTADERVLPGGTAYITDIGFVGGLNSIIGAEPGVIIQRFLTFQRAGKFAIDVVPPFVFNGALITVDSQTGRATAIERVSFIDEVLTPVPLVEETQKQHGS